MLVGLYDIGRDLSIDLFNRFLVPVLKEQKEQELEAKAVGLLLGQYPSVLSLIIGDLNSADKIDRQINRCLCYANSRSLTEKLVAMRYEDDEVFTPFAELNVVGFCWLGFYTRLRRFKTLEEGISWLEQSDAEISRQIGRGYLSVRELSREQFQGDEK